MFNQPRKVLEVSSLTTPALTTGADARPNAAGFGGGRREQTMFMVEVARGNGTSMTGVTWKVWGSRTGVAGTWVQLPCYKSSDATAALGASQTVNVSSNTTAYEGLVCPAARDWPFLDITARAATADPVAGDSALAYLPPWE